MCKGSTSQSEPPSSAVVIVNRARSNCIRHTHASTHTHTRDQSKNEREENNNDNKRKRKERKLKKKKIIILIEKSSFFMLQVKIGFANRFVSRDKHRSQKEMNGEKLEPGERRRSLSKRGRTEEFDIKIGTPKRKRRGEFSDEN